MAIAALLPGCASSGLVEGDRLPGFSAQTIDGSTFSTAGTVGHPTIVQFFIVDDGTFKQYRKDLYIYRQMANASDELATHNVTVVLIAHGPPSISDYGPPLRALRSQYGGDWPMISDPAEKIGRKFDSQLGYETFIFDGHGRLAGFDFTGDSWTCVVTIATDPALHGDAHHGRGC
jgi:peroxiredoxin